MQKQKHKTNNIMSNKAIVEFNGSPLSVLNTKFSKRCY